MAVWYVIRRELFCPPNPSTILDDFVISMRVIMANKRISLRTGLHCQRKRHSKFQLLSIAVAFVFTAGAVQTWQWGNLAQFRAAGPIEFWQWVSHKTSSLAEPGLAARRFRLHRVVGTWSQMGSQFYWLYSLHSCRARILAQLIPSLRPFKIFGICY